MVSHVLSCTCLGCSECRASLWLAAAFWSVWPIEIASSGFGGGRKRLTSSPPLCFLMRDLGFFWPRDLRHARANRGCAMRSVIWNPEKGRMVHPSSRCLQLPSRCFGNGWKIVSMWFVFLQANLLCAGCDMTVPLLPPARAPSPATAVSVVSGVLGGDASCFRRAVWCGVCKAGTLYPRPNTC